MKHISLFALALAFSVNASAGVFCFRSEPPASISVNGYDKNAKGIQKVKIAVDVAAKAKGFDEALNIEGYAHFATNGKIFILAGDPNNGVDLQVNSLHEGDDYAQDSVMDVSVKGKNIKLSLNCLENKD